jgi:DNA-binding HxlR family transcriptional regulator
MSEDKELKDEVKKLKEELAALKEQLRETAPESQEQRRSGIYIDLEGLTGYMGDVMEGVAEGIRGELKKSVFISPNTREIKIYHRGREEEPEEETVKADPAKAAAIMNALGEEHRLKILSELMSGGKYISDLQSSMPEITASTLSSHLDVLQEAGLVVQERVRGRYLVTIPGRMAYKMANMIVKQRNKHFEL